MASKYNSTDDTVIHAVFRKQIEEGRRRFPLLFDARLLKGLERFIVNSSNDFFTTRPRAHLRSLLLTQYFLQKKIEATLQSGSVPGKSLFLKIFQRPARICIALCFGDFFHLHREQLLKTIHILIPGVHEVPGSFCLWHHPEMAYQFCYMEVNKLRGEELSILERREFENCLRENLIAIPPLTPALFWPYNEEESWRQIQLLQGEIHSEKDLPHVLIQFREQTPSTLEFLVHLVRPDPVEDLDAVMKRIPESLHAFCHFTHVRKAPFPMESSTFSLKVPSCAFDVRESINLLYARRYVLKILEAATGELRDCNGGLFEKQQQHFERIRMHLGDRIRHFDIFAEKVFYAINPVERRLSLSLAEAEDLFSAFSGLMQEKESVTEICRQNVKILRTSDQGNLFNGKQLQKAVGQAAVDLGGFHYYCMFCPKGLDLHSFLTKSPLVKKKTSTLRLLFQEGAPPSLNPYHSYGDMRCRVLSKLLFEGLTRLNAASVPEPAGAEEISVSQDGLKYTFRLRPSHWSNGEKVSAADYTMTLQYALSDHVSHPELLFIVKNARLFKEKKVGPRELGIRTLSADILQIELERPDPRFLHKLAQPFFFPLFGPMREPKWFNGAYLVREQTAEGIILGRNPWYRGYGVPCYGQIDIRWIEDVDLIHSLFLQGKTDWIGDPLSTLSPQIISDLKKNGQLRSQSVSRCFLILFNTHHPILSSAPIRKALSLCIDRTGLCDTLFPECIPRPPLFPDPQKANLLFEQGLKELGMSRDCFPRLTFSYSHQTRREVLAESLRSAWQDILGITVHLEKNAWNTFRIRLEKGLFEIAASIQESLEEDSLEFYQRVEGATSWNFSQWHHAAFRDLYSGATIPKRKRQKAIKILNTEVPTSPLFSYSHLFAHSHTLQNYLVDPEGCIDFSQTFPSDQ